MVIGKLISKDKFALINEIINIEKTNPNKTICELDKLYYDNHRIILYFKYFIIQTYDEELWYDLLDMRKFRKLFYYSVEKYGKDALGGLVDFASKYLNTAVFAMLVDFSEYVKTVENKAVHDFAQFVL